MVARIFRLRLALLRARFAGGYAAALRTLGLFSCGVGAAIVLAYAPVWLLPAGKLAAADTVIGVLLLSVAVLVPFFDSRRNLQLRQFVTFPAGSAKTAAALLLSAVLSVPFLWFASWLIALICARPAWFAAGWVLPVVYVLLALLVLSAVRVLADFPHLIFGEARLGLLRMCGWLLAIACLPVLVFALAGVFTDNSKLLAETARPLAWAAFGAGFNAIHAAAAGDFTVLPAALGVLIATLLGCLALWFLLARRAFNTIAKPLSPTNARHELGWFERFQPRPAQVIAARQLTYWLRDPRYRVTLVALPVAPAAVMVAFLIAGVDLHLAVLLPLPVLLLLLGWSQHNDIAIDSTAIWEHVASGISGRADRAGRLIPVLLLGLPLALVGASLTVTFFGDWRALPAVFAVNCAVLCTALAVASVFSALFPYPATRPGDSPFMQPQWSGSGSGSAQTLSMLATLLLLVPPVWCGVYAIFNLSFATIALTASACLLYAVLMVLGGVVLGGRIFDQKGPEILAVTQIFD